MRLHYATNTISIAVAITLEEAGLDWEPVQVDFTTAEQTTPGYHGINPKGRVPALDLGGGAILTETGAILDYIATRAPGAGLVPQDPLEAARMREVMYYIASTMHVNHAHRMRGHRWANEKTSWEDMTAKVPETMTASAAHIEATSLQGPLVLGDTLTLADPYLFIVCTWLPGDKVDLAPFPKIRAFIAAMDQRASVKTVREKGMLSLRDSR